MKLLAKARSVLWTAAVATGVAGCNNGSWVDAPTLCSFQQTIDKERAEGKATPESEEAVAGFTKMGAQEACGRVGKSFTGDIDCEDGNSRVKCK
jgi:hypothetical protein